MPIPLAQITETGITAPTYAEVLAYLQGEFRRIYGADIYIEPDSQDGQQIAVFAQAIHDTNSMAVAVFNAYSPSTAQGAGLSANVKLNGLARRIASFSTVDLRIIGQAGATIVSGVVRDADGNRWVLPTSVVVPPAGEITVTATAAAPGALRAPAGTVTTIATPTQGWQSVTNPLAATPGAPVESDADLRRRQAVSTMIPSRSILEGLVGAVAELPGVTRYRAYENDGGAPDANGQPGNTIALVVQGGDTTAIAQTIALKKGPGSGTHGTTVVDVVDSFGITRAVRFFRPAVVPIRVALNLTALPGYTAAIQAKVVQSITDYLNAQPIGLPVYWMRLLVPANLFGAAESRTFEINSLTVARGANPLAAADVAIAFNEAMSGQISDVSITVV
ncbi:baseplate J/gp47 family protein [Salinarimonas soli]|uniref:Baseplate protein J-like barrel domain-containing protein n=1 Tax=Salinarimonas soli TaxID=1638099 RepID=A0A5B2VH37_9HYPH|nr:baseplate J/gp47 family protein [Salinarimonas soli]KAA2237662.1 hypothetical protein F0L46_08250 [Salinarimonas soli]